jgi:hypothetical protein
MEKLGDELTALPPGTQELEFLERLRRTLREWAEAENVLDVEAPPQPPAPHPTPWTPPRKRARGSHVGVRTAITSAQCTWTGCGRKQAKPEKSSSLSAAVLSTRRAFDKLNGSMLVARPGSPRRTNPTTVRRRPPPRSHGPLGTMDEGV